MSRRRSLQTALLALCALATSARSARAQGSSDAPGDAAPAQTAATTHPAASATPAASTTPATPATPTAPAAHDTDDDDDDSAPLAAPTTAAAQRTLGRVVAVRLDPELRGEDPWAIVGLQPGAELDMDRARRALQTALGGGTFAEARASLRHTPQGLMLVIRGERRVTIREVAYTGVAARPLDNVRADFGIADGESATMAEVETARARLQQAYRDAGFDDATVRTSLRETDDPARRVLIVTVREGPPTVVRRIVLHGVAPELEDAVRTASGITEGGIADPQGARRSLDAIYTVLRGACLGERRPIARADERSANSVEIVGGSYPAPRNATSVARPAPAEARRACYLNAQVAPPRFERVSPARVDAVIDVTPGLAYSIEWSGVSRVIQTRALTDALRLGEEHELDTTTLSVLVNRVRDWYVRHAFLDVRVRGEVVLTTPGRAELRFTVREGPQVFVRNLTFPGAIHVEPSALRELLWEYLTTELTEREGLGDPGEDVSDALDGGTGFSAASPPARLHLYPDRTYVPDLYTEATHRMQNRFREQGFLEANVPTPELHRAVDDRGRPVLDVTFRITEGPRTLLEEVAFEGNHAIPGERLIRQTQLRLGVPLSNSARDEARTAIVEYYREQGYLFARVDPQSDISPDHTRARVRFVVHEGPLVRVGRIIVRGNRATNRGIIIERVHLRAGQLYRPSLVRTSQRQLMELQVFSAVTIVPADPDVEAPVKDIVVHVFEQRPQYLEIRGGFSTGEGVRAALEYGYRNLAGTAITVSLRAQLGYQIVDVIPDRTFQDNYRQLSILGQLRRRLSLSLNFPALPAVGPDVRATVDLGHSRSIERQFAIETTGASGSVIYRPSREFTLTFTEELQRNGLELLGADSINDVLTTARGTPDFDRIRRLLLLPVGTTDLLAHRITTVIDLRDQVFNPQRGFLISLTGEYVNILGSQTSADQRPADTLRGIASVTGYLLLPFGNIVLASNLRLGRNLTFAPASDPYVNHTYTNRLFFLGGSESMRGWIQDTFIPEDVVTELRNGCNPNTTMCTPPDASQVLLAQRGGNAFINWRTEARIPFGTTGFALGLFLDLGNLWKNPDYFDALNLRAAAGAGIRYTTPIGPLALDLGFNLSRRADILEIPYAVNFSIGVF